MDLPLESPVKTATRVVTSRHPDAAAHAAERLDRYLHLLGLQDAQLRGQVVDHVVAQVLAGAGPAEADTAAWTALAFAELDGLLASRCDDAAAPSARVPGLTARLAHALRRQIPRASPEPAPVAMTAEPMEFGPLPALLRRLRPDRLGTSALVAAAAVVLGGGLFLLLRP